MSGGLQLTRDSTEQHERNPGRHIASVLSRGSHTCGCHIFESGVEKVLRSSVVSAVDLRIDIQVRPQKT